MIDTGIILGPEPHLNEVCKTVVLALKIYFVDLIKIIRPARTSFSYGFGLVDAIVATPFILLIISATVNYIAGLFLAHRFAGPTKLIVEFLDQLIEGKPTVRRDLRPTDELKIIMTKLHELADRIEIGPK